MGNHIFNAHTKLVVRDCIQSFFKANPFGLNSSFSCICFLFKFPFHYSDILIIYYFILKFNLNQLLLVCIIQH